LPFDASETNFEAFDKQELTALFPLYKRALYPFIEKTFGWDETFQRERVQSAYPLDSLYWASYRAATYGATDKVERGAVVSVKQQEGVLHLHLLIVLENLRAQGIGQTVMQALHQHATQHGQIITLSCFKSNPRALRFYQKLGYQVTAEEEHFFDLSWRPSQGSPD
jgi:ribosomal protein S18 acetylase RimI-like enzyme